MVACTGNAGCKFALANTKAHALQIVDHLEARVTLHRPVNIHLTGCPNSCAQHFIGDIGLLGTKVAVGEDEVEGYHIFVGGGYGARQDIGRGIYPSVPAAECGPVIERMLKGYLANRADDEETFQDFVKRHPTEALKSLFET